MTFIYALIHEKEIYVGKSDDPNRRFANHLVDNKPSKKRFWLLNLKKRNILPKLVIIEKVNNKNWQLREIFWISYYRNLDYNVMNIANGGEGGAIRKGIPCSKETKRKLGKKASQRTGIRNSFFGKHHSEKSRESMSSKRKGKTYEEFYGEEKGKEMREKRRQQLQRKGLTAKGRKRVYREDGTWFWGL